MNFIEYLYEKHHILLLITLCVFSIIWCISLVFYPAITIGATSGFIFYRLFEAYKRYRKERGIQLKGQ